MGRHLALILALAAASSGVSAQLALTLPEAERLALLHNPAILIQQAQARSSAGVATQARSPFDTVLSAGIGSARDQRALRADELRKYPGVGAEQLLRSDAFHVGADRLLESGPEFGATYAYNGASDNLQGAQAIPLQASDRLSFTLRLPLQKSPAAAAAEALRAADEEARAARLDTEQTVAATVLAVAQGYWDWAGRVAGLNAARVAEERVEKLAADTEKLVAMDELPPAEINLIRASRMERAAARVAAEERSLESRNALGRLLGMNAEQAGRLLIPADPLPQKASADPGLSGLLALALSTRRDLAALRLRERAAPARLDAARANTRPQSDLVFSGYYAGLREGGGLAGSLPLAAQSAGPGVSAALVFQFPLENSAAAGALDAAYANLDAARLKRASLEDAISVALAQAHAALMAVAAQLQLSSEVVERYRISVRNEETKRLLGSATLIDVLNIEDRLNNALIARLQYQQAYAAARAQLLYEAGRLIVAGDDGRYSLDFKALLP